MRVRATIEDRFLLQREVGEGGMATVYEAIDTTNGERVALKLLRARQGGSGARFGREASLLAKLNHPGVVRYVAHGLTREGAPYLAMEWLDGDTLARKLRDGALSLRATCDVAVQVLEALATAHRAGIVHRDIKPSNIFLLGGARPVVKVLDFGIARRVLDSAHLTRSGATVGTPQYMAPEQARGERTIDARADFFSLGCVLFECLTGQPPFRGENVLALLSKICLEEAPRVSSRVGELPDGFDALLGRMLAKEAANRPGDASSLAAEWLGLASSETEAPAGKRSVTYDLAQNQAEQRVFCIVLVARDAATNPTSSGLWSTHRVGHSDDTLIATSDSGHPPACGDSSLPPPPTPEVEELQALLRHYQGALHPLVGGSLVLTFGSLSPAGTPTDQALAAARCATHLREILPQSRVALCTGRAVMFGQLPMGEVIDRAARLLENVPEPCIQLDETSADLLEGRFQVEKDRGLLRLGRSREDSEGPRLLHGKPTPCVGRERELGILESVLRDSISEEVARAVLVTSPAGGGKSRLLHEFLSRQRRRDEPILLLEASGDSLHAQSPFRLIAMALRGFVGIDVSAPIQARRQIWRDAIAELCAPSDAQRVTHFLGELVDVPFDDAEDPKLRAARREPRIMADQMLCAWLDFLRGASTARPIVLVLDDIHWCDSPSSQFVDAALRALHDRPLFVFALARPEVHDAFPNLWSERELLTLPLSALSKKACERLVDDVLGLDAGAEQRAWIVEQAQGNAFYLEELIRAKLEGQLRIPDTVIGMVQARLDALGDDAKRILRVASVFGETFHSSALSALLGDGRTLLDVKGWLKVLTEKEIVLPRSAASGEYSFRHALIRDAAYALFTKDDRELAHRLAGRWLESAIPAEPAVLAQHYEKGCAAEEAARWYAEAALQALESGDLAGVYAQVERGLHCGAAHHLRGELLAMRAEAHQWRGENTDAYAHAQAALPLLAEGTPFWFRAQATLCLAGFRLGQPSEVLSAAEEVVSKAQHMSLDAPRLIALAKIGLTLSSSTRRDLVPQLLTFLESSSHADDPAIRGWVLLTRSYLATQERGSAASEEQIALTQAALEAFQEAGDRYSSCIPYINIASALLDLGDSAAAEQNSRACIALAEGLGLRLTMEARVNLSLALAAQGRHEEARREAELVLAETDRNRDLWILIHQWCYLAWSELQAGELEAAERCCEHIAAEIEEAPHLEALYFVTQAMVDLARDAPQQAHFWSTKAMDVLHEGNCELHATLIRTTHAEALDRTGRSGQARELLATACDYIVATCRNIRSDHLRRTFRFGLPENARALALAARWGVAVDSG